MIRRPPRSTHCISSAASDVYKRQMQAADAVYGVTMQEPGVSTIVGVRLGQMEPA